MQLGMIGPGRIGASPVRRLARPVAVKGLAARRLDSNAVRKAAV